MDRPTMTASSSSSSTRPNPWMLTEENHWCQWLQRESKISRYQCLHENNEPPIGEGTYGRVWKYLDKEAKDPDRGALRALKEIFVRARSHEGFPTQAVREIRCLKKVVHPNVVRLHDVCIGLPDLQQEHNQFTSKVYLVFEFVEHDLSGLIRARKGVLDLAEAKCLARQMLDGLVYLHGKNLMHRDLKLSNLLLSKSGEVKIADFGLARTVEVVENYTSTASQIGVFNRAGAGASSSSGASSSAVGRNTAARDHSSRGGVESGASSANANPQRDVENPPFTNKVVTLWYRAPELVLGSKYYSLGIDTFAAGCVLAELVTGRVLFRVQNEQQLLELQVRQLGTPPRHLYKQDPITYPLAFDNSKISQFLNQTLQTVPPQPPRIEEYLFQILRDRNIPTDNFSARASSSMAGLPVRGGHQARLQAASATSAGGANSKRFQQLTQVILGLLHWDASKRFSAEDAFNHAFFTDEHPLPCKASDLRLDMGESFHGYTAKRRRVN
ncbi:unnamed protein product [Amoebophrya sp. A120]|nr:unnamed protein product [Amoebophrya sp. A120]|eukprot:GSA120T00023632001.1